MLVFTCLCVEQVASSYSSVASETSLAPSQTLLTKVSSISTTDENKGVSIVRSHEVPGKSSTDGRTSSVAGKTSGNLSLDAVAKAKRAIQMGKGLADKLKNLPLVRSADILAMCNSFFRWNMYVTNCFLSSMCS